MQKEETMARALMELRRVEAGEAPLFHRLDPANTFDEVFFTNSDWEFHVFNDNGDWDYITAVVPPRLPGLRRLNYDDIHGYDEPGLPGGEHVDEEYASIKWGLANYAPPPEVWQKVYQPLLEATYRARMARKSSSATSTALIEAVQ